MIVRGVVGSGSTAEFQINLTPMEMLNLFGFIRVAMEQGDLSAEAFHERLFQLTHDALVKVGSEKTFPELDEWTNGCIKVGWLLPKQSGKE